MHIVDKRKEYTIPLKNIANGMVFEDMSSTLFMKIDLDDLCYPPHSDYSTTDAAVNLEEFEVVFFDNTTEVCPVRNAELTLS